LPELNDEFAKTVGATYENLDQLKEALKKELELRSRAVYEDEFFFKLIDKVKEGAVIKYPPQVLEHESEHILDDLRQRLAAQNMDLEAYFKLRGTTQEKFIEEEAHPLAANHLERGLILGEIASRHNIQVDGESLNLEFNLALQELAYRGAVDVEKLNKSDKDAKERFTNAVASQAANRLLTRRALDKLKSIALGEWKPEDDAPPQEPEAESQAGETAARPEVQEEAGGVQPPETEPGAE